MLDKFRTFLIKNLELKEKEVDIFVLLFLHSFFIGWFVAFYFVSANSIFIVNYGSQQLPYAYILAGIFGYLTSSLYSLAQKYVNSRMLFMGALLFMFLISLVGPIGLNYIPEKYLSIFVFIWAWPFISLSSIELGGLAIRFLNLAQVKRLYGLFNMGGVLAAILSYFAIPFLKSIVPHLYFLLYIGAGALIVAIIILQWIYKVSGEKEDIKITAKQKSEKPKISFFSLLKEKYFVWIFLGATLSMTMIYLVDFGFLSSVKVSINPDHVAQYLGIVFGALKVGELIISYYSRRLLSHYGVKLGLTILPLTTTSLILLGIFVAFVFGANTILFLGVMTLLKSMERILRRGLDDPAFNILYQPLPDDKKLAVQVRVGVVMQLSIGIAGILLWLANRLLVTDKGFQLQYYPLLVLPIVLFWVYVAINLYKSYKEKIREILAEISKDKRRGTDKYQYGSEILKKRLVSDDLELIEFSSTILSEENPKILEPYASSILKQYKEEFLIRILLKSIDPTWRKRLAKVINSLLELNLNEETKLIAQRAYEFLDYSEINEEISAEQAQKLLFSDNYKDRIKLIKYIHKKLYRPQEEELIKLMEDENKYIRLAAINISPVLKTDAIIRKLVSYIENKEYRHIVGNVILEFGSMVLKYLDEYFDAHAPRDILLKILEIYAKIGTREAKKLLLKHMDYPDREVQLEAIWGLFFCKFQAQEDAREKIKKRLEETVENLAWIYTTIEDLYDKKGTLKLFMALEYEKDLNLEILFLLLSFIYEPRIITLIQKNIVGKEIIFALEIIDNFFESDIKKLINPIFEDVAPSIKIKRLSKRFPQQRMSFEQRLKDIILRDYNKISPWTIAKAIEVLGRIYKKSAGEQKVTMHDYSDIVIWNKENIQKVLSIIRKSDIPDEIFAALYHTEEIVYSTAAKIIFDENPVKCFDYLANMSPHKQKLIKILSHNGFLIQDKIKYFKRHPLFFNVAENNLIKIAEISEIVNLNKGMQFDYSSFKEDVVIIILKGHVSDATHHFINDQVLIRGINLDIFTQTLNIEENSQLIIIKRTDFFDALISDRYLITEIMASQNAFAHVFKKVMENHAAITQ